MGLSTTAMKDSSLGRRTQGQETISTDYEVRVYHDNLHPQPIKSTDSDQNLAFASVEGIHIRIGRASGNPHRNLASGQRKP